MVPLVIVKVQQPWVSVSQEAGETSAMPTSVVTPHLGLLAKTKHSEGVDGPLQAVLAKWPVLEIFELSAHRLSQHVAFLTGGAW